MSSNPHQPITEDRTIRCAAEDCTFAMHRLTARPEQEQTRIDDYLLELFRSTHADQYSPGRAPDITVDWTISACCSVCPDGIGDTAPEDDARDAQEDCTHPSLTGDEGPIADLGRWPKRWRCDTCGATVEDAPSESPLGHCIPSIDYHATPHRGCILR